MKKRNGLKNEIEFCLSVDIVVNLYQTSGGNCSKNKFEWRLWSNFLIEGDIRYKF